MWETTCDGSRAYGRIRGYWIWPAVRFRSKEGKGTAPQGSRTEITDYDSRRTGNGLLDTGSTPVYSIKNLAFVLGWTKGYLDGTQKGTQRYLKHLRKGSCTSTFLNIQKCALFGVAKRTKVAALHVTKVIYDAVILWCDADVNFADLDFKVWTGNRAWNGAWKRKLLAWRGMGSRKQEICPVV